MVVALAGRRVHATPALEEAVESALREAGATVLVSSAAAGADLVALDAAARLGIRRRVVLPFAPDEFRATSVADKPGDWGERYDRLMRELPREDLIVLAERRSPGAWLAGNGAVLDDAERLAGNGGAVAVAVWEGHSRGDGDTTAAFVEEAKRRGIRLVHVSTLVDESPQGVIH